ncbi:MAG: hypothetical protein GC192_07115 [Bacteroidetes bacterium]|nr:hypothetical protein [Bacteroidota bacterium]
MEKSEKKVAEQAFAKERQNALHLLATNPNHFGTLASSKLKAVQLVSYNTYYEELTCVGYNPDLNELFATIAIKRDSGYSGSLCTHGSREYVRFCVNYGTGWEDQGMVALNVHDIPTGKDCANQSEKPLSYVVSIPLKNAKRRFCSTEVLPLVRATLSWGIPIPAGDCDYKPIWGDREECRIQLKPWLFLLPIKDFELDTFIPSFLEIAKSAPQLTVTQVTELANEGATSPSSLAAYDAEPLSLSALAELYGKRKGAEVEPLRFGLHAIQPILSQPESLANLNILTNQLPNINWAGIFETFNKTKANVNYEELECLGLDYNLERLTATFKIKKSGGYSGDLCKKGSMEHVAFWADWDNDCKWTYLDMVSVNVHDLEKVDKGVCYTAVLPVNLDRFRQPCSKPKIVRLRAVLSWQTLPSTTDPNELETYGNRIDTHIQIKPGKTPTIADPNSWVDIIGGIYQDHISAAGLTTAAAFFANNGLKPDNLGRPCPFTGRINMQGPSLIGHKYRVQVRRLGTVGWTDVVEPIPVRTYIGSGIFIYTYNHPDAAGYFNYLDPNTTNRVLALWDAPSNPNNLASGSSAQWEMKFDILGVAGNFTKVVQLNAVRPDAEIVIDGLGGPGTGTCKDFKPGDKMTGHFVARSNYMGNYSLGTSVPGASITPSAGNSNTAVSPGDAWAMTLPAGTPKCGYYVAVNIGDRTIINSSHTGLPGHADAGFCVR